MDRIQKQASDLWTLLFAEETADIYQAALDRTGTILTDIAQLLWLIICSVFVFGAWLSDASVKAGNNIRNWVDQQASSSPTAADSKPLSETGKDVLDSSRTAIMKLLNRAKEELGLEAEPLPASTSQKTIASASSQVPSIEKTASSNASSDTNYSSAAAPTAVPKASPAAVSSVPTATASSTMVSASSTEDVDEDINDEDLDEEEIESWPPQTADD